MRATDAGESRSNCADITDHDQGHRSHPDRHAPSCDPRRCGGYREPRRRRGRAGSLGGAPGPHGAAGGEVAMADLLAPGPLDDQIQGQADAPVTIVEYASMTCPHCSHFHETTYPEMKKKYIDTGKVRFIFREFPLDQLALAASML